ncbi:MAG: hypothetical protein LBE32_02385 [Burkholderiales bacterium]|nr:hypothetical protein [Burkholderiales bacterium]
MNASLEYVQPAPLAVALSLTSMVLLELAANAAAGIAKASNSIHAITAVHALKDGVRCVSGAQIVDVCCAKTFAVNVGIIVARKSAHNVFSLPPS